MAPNNNGILNRGYMILFIFLTFLCWCPVLYGSYGETSRFHGIPGWAAIALLIGLVLFALEWAYLFFSRLALDDQVLPEIVSALNAVENPHNATAKEGN